MRGGHCWGDSKSVAVIVCRRRHQREVTERLRDGERADDTEQATGTALEWRSGQHSADDCAHQHCGDQPTALGHDSTRSSVSPDCDHRRARSHQGTAHPARP